MDFVEELYYIWEGNNPLPKSIEEQRELTNDVVRKNSTVEHKQAIDDTIEDYATIHQLEGFKAGFETCRRLLLADKRLIELLKENKQIVKMFK